MINRAGTTVTLQLSETHLKGGFQTSDWSYTVDSRNRGRPQSGTLNAAQGTITLTLSPAVNIEAKKGGTPVTVSYSRSGTASQRIRDQADKSLASFSRRQLEWDIPYSACTKGPGPDPLFPDSPCNPGPDDRPENYKDIRTMTEWELNDPREPPNVRFYCPRGSTDCTISWGSAVGITDPFTYEIYHFARLELTATCETRLFQASKTSRLSHETSPVGVSISPPRNLPTGCTLKNWVAAVSVKTDSGKVSGAGWARPAPPTPDDPGGFSLTVPSAGSIELSWDDPGDDTITHQYQQRVKNTAWPATWSNMTGATGTYAVSSGLSERTFYEYRLRASRGVDLNSGPTETRAGAYGKDSAAAGDEDNLTGTTYPDYVIALAGNDTVRGTAADDELYGGAGNDTLVGGAGADTLYGGAGNDNLDGDAGDDTLHGGGGADDHDGGAGTDTASYAGSPARIILDLAAPSKNRGYASGDTFTSIEKFVGSAHKDTLVGNSSDNVLIGAAGADNIRGSGGNDTIDGGAGADKLEFSDGSITGGGGADEFFFTAGATAVTVSITDYATGENIWICGGTTSSDVTISQSTRQGSRSVQIDIGAVTSFIGLDGYTGTATVAWSDPNAEAGTGCNFYSAAPELDTGPDTPRRFDLTVPNAGSIKLSWTDPGDATITHQYQQTVKGYGWPATWTDMPGATSTFTISSGLDDRTFYEYRLRASRGTNLNSAPTETLAGAYGKDRASEGIFGWDNLTGTLYPDYVILLAGNDTVNGAAGDDELFGGAGDDVLNGGPGADAHDGGAGTDTASYEGSPSGITLDLANPGNSTGWASGDTFTGIEIYTGSLHNDTFASGTASHFFDGDAGWEDTASYEDSPAGITLDLTTPGNNTGWASGDTFTRIERFVGSTHNDTLTGDGSDNFLIGLAGGDTIDGRGGSDTAAYNDSNAVVTVNLNTNSHSGGHAQGDSLTNIENVIGSSHDDTLTGDGNANVMTGLAGADIIDGLGDSDTASYRGSDAGVIVNISDTSTETGGHAQGDSLTNIENIIGSSHNDSLTGNANANVLAGEAGADTINGLGGSDTASYAASGSGVTVNISDTSAETGGHAQGDSLVGIENITGSSHNDVLTGDGNANVLKGSARNDILIGLAGADTLDGGDEWLPSIGIFLSDLSGYDRGDTASYADSNAGVTVDISDANTETGGHAQGDKLIDIENITGSSHNDRLIGNSDRNILRGGAGADEIRGSGGLDSILGGAGDDKLEFSSGGIWGGAGTDEFFFSGDHVNVAMEIFGYEAGEKIWVCVGTSGTVNISTPITYQDGAIRGKRFTVSLGGVRKGTFFLEQYTGGVTVAWSDPNAAAGTGCNF